MYLNILLKRKKEPPRHFSFNGSTTIKTDKEHIHRGFKDHKGLSYAFNGPTKINTDNKLLYRGFTKNYAPSRFHHSKDDNEYLKNFNLHPTTKPVELFTEYKNKYPKLSDNEYSLETWQTEKGVPNQLNRFMRQEKTGRSIETIEADDNDYRQGLLKLEDNIKNKRQEIKDNKVNFDYDDKDKEKHLKEYDRNINSAKRAIKKYANPVTIKPAIKKDEKYTFDEERVTKALETDAIRKQAAMDNLAKRVKKRYGLKTKSSGVEETKTNEPQKAPTKPLLTEEETKTNEPQKAPTKPLLTKEEKITKLQSIVRQKLAKKAVDNRRKSIDTSDAKTDIVDTNPQVESYKANFKPFKDILSKYVHLPDTSSIDDFDPDDKVKIKGFIQALGIPMQTKKLDKLRNKLK